MPFSFSVPMDDNGSVYVVRKLLANGKSNTKIGKSDKAGLPIITQSLSLAPALASGYNLCPEASKACIKDCLYTSGQARLTPRTIQPARIAKSRFLRKYPVEFEKRLREELHNGRKLAARKGVSLYVRLNTISDVQWEREFPTLMSDFPEILFYDYTKIYKRMIRYLNGELPDNLHLTFSWSGVNLTKSLDVLNRGGNLAVPFDVKYQGEKRRPLPTTWHGFPIIDGDLTDLRPKDKQGGYVVGLRAKGEARKDKDSGFVVNPNAPECGWGPEVTS